MPAADIAELERQALEASFWEIREGPNTSASTAWRPDVKLRKR
jgi:hypothetical protein